MAHHFVTKELYCDQKPHVILRKLPNPQIAKASAIGYFIDPDTGRHGTVWIPCDCRDHFRICKKCGSCYFVPRKPGSYRAQTPG